MASEPPLIPISEDASPRRKPQADMARRPGSWWANTQFSRPTSSLMAMVPAISTKASLNMPAGANAAATDPTATPATAGSAQDRSTPGITSPFARCAR